MTREISGLRKIDYKVDGVDPVKILYLGWRSVLAEAEGDDETIEYLYEQVGEELESRLFHMLTTRIVRTDSTLFPEYRSAIVEVTGEWVNGDGDSTTLKGLEEE